MADKAPPITPEDWETALGIFMQTRATMKVARRMKWPYSFTDTLVERGIPNHFPPIRQVAAERKAAKANEIPPSFPNLSTPPVKKLHVVYPATQPTTAADNFDNVETAPPKLTPPKPAPIVAPEASALQTGDTAAALATALDNVHRDLATALGRESKLVGGLREQAIGLTSGATAAIKAFDEIITRLTAEITKKAQRGELLEERRAFMLLTKLARVSRTAAEQAERAIKLQRLIAGLPQAITADVSPGKGADRIADLNAITDRLEALQSARRSRVIDIDAPQYKGEESGGD